MNDSYDFNFIVLEIGGSFHHTKGRERARMRVRIRDGFRCQSCFKRRTPREVSEHNRTLPTSKGQIKLYDVHHLNGECGKNSRGYDKTKDISKLVTLCHKCHFNHHQFSQKEIWTSARFERETIKRAIKEGNQKVLAKVRSKASVRTLEMVELRGQGISCAAIAKKYKISRTRIGQILTSVGVSTRNPPKPKVPKPKPIIERDCRGCPKSFIASNNTIVFCSIECRLAYRREYNAIKTRNWYKEHVNDPVYQEVIRRRNHGEKGLSIHDAAIRTAL